jgi:hypothetical protein
MIFIDGHGVYVMFKLQLLLIVVALAGCESARAATITVTGTANTVAVDGAVTLAEAIASINAGSNTNADVSASGSYGVNDTIVFAIPGAGVHTIVVDSTLILNKPAKIDGYTQPGATPNSLGAGQGSNAKLQIELTINSSGGFALFGGGSTMQGLVVNGEGISLRNFGGNTIAGNFFGTDAAGSTAAPPSVSSVVDIYIDSSSPNNMIGGTTPAARNVISGAPQAEGILINSSGNVIQGNLIGTNAAGDAALGNYSGIYALLGGADNNLIGGTSPGAGNVVSGNTLIGIEVDTLNNQIEGNFVGTNAAGTAAIANGEFGIVAAGANNTVGGTTAGAGNLVSGNGSVGIGIPYGISGNVVAGNKVGTDVTGTQIVCGHSTAGIEVSGGGNTIGGAQAGAGNLVAFNKLDGVRIDGQTANAILHNYIFSNGGGGIVLGSNGVGAPNDPGDADNGPNGFQNHPVLSVTGVGSVGFDIGATLDSSVGVFHFEFFSSPACGRFGYGEGKTFIGSADVASDSNGITTFASQLFATPPGQTAITGTATDPAGNTSEFSACLDDRIFTTGFEPPPAVCI